MANMHSVDTDIDEEEISLNNNYYGDSEEYYEIFGKIKNNVNQDTKFSKYLGKNRIYVYIVLKLFNPLYKIILRVNSLSKIIKYRYDKKQIYIYYDPNTKKVSGVKKIDPSVKI